MRIIAGRLRHRTLKVAGHFRPTTDRVRETLFNILQTEIRDCVFVDAFAGSGAVGIEAMSREARQVYFLENDRRVLSVLERNLLQCGDAGAWRIYAMPALRGMEEVRKSAAQTDIVFFDPPYDYAGYPDLLRKAADLFPESLLILESSTRSQYEVPETLVLVKERRIGETRLAFLRASPLPVLS